MKDIIANPLTLDVTAVNELSTPQFHIDISYLNEILLVIKIKLR